MINQENPPKRSGKFQIGSGEEIAGELTIAGRDSDLYVYDSQRFATFLEADQFVRGVLHDLTRVSLHSCILPPMCGRRTGNDGQYSFASIFPHFVLEGKHHVGPAEKVVSAIRFTIDDATTLFYDFDTFGHILNAEPYIEKMVRAQLDDYDPTGERSRSVTFGPEAQILYFTGKREIFRAETVLGTIVTSHNPMSNLGGPGGVGIQNIIGTTIGFGEPIIFGEAINRLLILVHFFEILVGRPQNLANIYVDSISDQEKRRPLKVHWSMAPIREREAESDQKPHPSEVLLDAVRRNEEFCRVLTNWLLRQSEWADARSRFTSCFNQQRRFDIDRLVSAANMFDILPNSAIPAGITLSEELEKARDEARKAFKALPQTPERDSVLSVLGRVGDSTLKRKIRHRAELIRQSIGDRYPELNAVIDEAVTCRNHYVHGTEGSFDYNANFNAVVFFTETFEFVFATSDLVEAGWNMQPWLAQGTTYAHPFGEFSANYKLRLDKLKRLLPVKCK